MSSPEIVTRLAAMLRKAQSCTTSAFTGLGVIVWDGVTELPVCALTDEQPTLAKGTLASHLAALGEQECPVHDGFHILTEDFVLVASGMYFSPPIVPGVNWDRTRHYGGRYAAALFGSYLPGVLATGVLSASYGMAIFPHKKTGNY